jgi:hypothetical protein
MLISGKTVTRVELSDAVYRTKAGLTRAELTGPAGPPTGNRTAH